jgi:hypothetical protein
VAHIWHFVPAGVFRYLTGFVVAFAQLGHACLREGAVVWKLDLAAALSPFVLHSEHVIHLFINVFQLL